MPAVDRRLDPRAALASVAGVGVCGLALAVVKLTTGWGVTCPFRAATGWRCPLCGSTTMAVHLLRGHPVAAVHDNPLVFAAACLAGAATALWTIELVLDRRVRTGRWGAQLTQRRFYWAGGVLAVAWTLVRNLVLHA